MNRQIASRKGREGEWADFKESAHMIVGADQSKICRTGQQAGNLGKISML
jgi:hypothetical protein